MTKMTPLVCMLAMLMALVLAVLTACTENERAKSFGGTMNLALPCGQKLTQITWKEDTLWYATRPMREGEVPENTTFHAETGLGLLEGKVEVTECSGVSETRY